MQWSPVYHFSASTWFNQPLHSVFEFFSNAGNLQRITPPWLHFEIQTPQPIAIEKGALIRYKLKLYGLPMPWLTEISAWEPPNRFVDTQLKGPYKQWIHEHRFEQHNGGTTVYDSVHYAIYGGPLAYPINALFVRRNVRSIFNYREEQLKDLFTHRPAGMEE